MAEFAEVPSALRWAWLAFFACAVLTFPSGRPDTAAERVGVAGAGLVALTLHVTAELGLVAMVVLLMAGTVWRATRRTQEEGPEALTAVLAGTTLAVGLLMPADVAYGLDASVILASAMLLVGVTAIARRRASLTADRAVELGPALADALGDPRFHVAIRAPDREQWLDTSGRAVDPPISADGTEVTTIERNGRVLALITHDPATSDPQIRTAVVKAVELAAHNARLRADLDVQLGELDSSRRRLLDAGLREREELGDQLQRDVLARLDRLKEEVDKAATVQTDADVMVRIEQAGAQVELARAEILELARGLYPSTLASAGLVGALTDLALRSPIEVAMDVPAGTTGGIDVDATIYFLCAEALANAARHAKASHLRIAVRPSGDALAVSVSDDGIGGADPDRGSGIRGLQDRVEAIGGALTIESVPGAGTRLAATIPCNREAPDPI